jgi:hypothetical protein
MAYPYQQGERAGSPGVQRRRRRVNVPPAWGARRKGVGIGDPTRAFRRGRMTQPGRSGMFDGRTLPGGGPTGIPRQLPEGGPLGQPRTLPTGGPLGQPRQLPGTGPGAGYLGPPQTQPGGAGGAPAQGGLPLDPQFEAGRRILEDELAARLGGLGPLRAALQAQGQLQEARLGTNEGIDRSHMMTGLAERGALGGGVQRQDEAHLATDYMRQRQDLANMIAGGLADYANQEADARGGYQRGLMELLLSSANNSAQSPYTPTPHAGPAAARRRRIPPRLQTAAARRRWLADHPR